MNSENLVINIYSGGFNDGSDIYAVEYVGDDLGMTLKIENSLQGAKEVYKQLKSKTAAELFEYMTQNENKKNYILRGVTQ